ncbi:MAG TPA: hypothetical protein VI819_04225 [Patescibacteria group bacterium]|nr:hypothetical protein [Patescibacteria group bacterium]
MFIKLKNLIHIPTWVYLILFAVLIFRIPTFFEPYSYGDETIYLTLGNAVQKGLTLYKDVHDNKPPLLYLTAAIAGNIFWFKAILAVVQLFGVIVFYKFIKLLFPRNQISQKAALLVYAILTTLPFFEGNIANAELFMIVPTIIAFYILLFRKNSTANLIFAGVLFSIASLFKMPAVFDIPAIVIYWLSRDKLSRKHLFSVAKKTLILSAGVAGPIFLTFIWYALNGAFKEYLVAAYLQNFGYLSSWRPDDVKEPFLVKNAPLLTRAFVVAIINLILVIKRKKFSWPFLFTVSWLTFALFGVTLSERPYPHYLVETIVPLSILFSMLFTYDSIEQVLVIFPLLLFSFIPFYFKFWNYHSANYYGNFLALASGKYDKNQYLETFGGNTLTNYKIAAIINQVTSKDDSVFVWEDSGQIYALTKRLPPMKYVAGYHIKDFYSDEALYRDLSAHPPKAIVVLKNSELPKSVRKLILTRYLMVEEIDGSQVWILMKVSL